MQPDKGTMLSSDGTEFDWADMLDKIWDRENHAMRVE